MSGIDETKPFHPVNIAVLTVSDSRKTVADDISGNVLAERIAAAGHNLVAREMLPDEEVLLLDQFKWWISDPKVDVVISTGGTGLIARDITPEVLIQVCDKEIVGFGELFRRLNYDKIGPAAMLSRATAGVAHGTYLFALPGSSNACKEAWDNILRWQLDSRYQPCNLVELIPRLQVHMVPPTDDDV